MFSLSYREDLYEVFLIGRIYMKPLLIVVNCDERPGTDFHRVEVYYGEKEVEWFRKRGTFTSIFF